MEKMSMPISDHVDYIVWMWRVTSNGNVILAKCKNYEVLVKEVPQLYTMTKSL